MISFGSDNHSGVHPSIMQAIVAANTGHEIAYGGDTYCAQAEELIRRVLDAPEARVFFTFNGTGSNVLSLMSATPPFGAIVCASTAHINVDECGAPERAIGCKVVAVEGVGGKLTPAMAQGAMHGFDFEHHSQPSTLSISQTTELGTRYTLDEIRALSDLAHSKGMYLHMDGARFANAVAGMRCAPSQIIRGVDVLSLGGTKNGMMMGEAVVILNPDLGAKFKYQRKQAMQLSSKMRYTGAQYLRYFRDDLWLQMASHSNAMARLLYEKIKDHVQVTAPVESNAIFAVISPEARAELGRRWFFYDWDESRDEVRWMCSFDTREEDVELFAADIIACCANKGTTMLNI